MPGNSSKPDIAIIGGSGLYALLEDAEPVAISTAYGKPSAGVMVGMLGGKRVAFISRHGAGHTLAPHKVPYRANIEALASMGVKRIIATNAVGSLVKHYAPGDFVLFDQFVNMTQGREDTFFDSDKVVHISTADPYCNELRAIAAIQSSLLGIRCHEAGTVVVVNGPRFSTRAESGFYSKQGFHTIGMTQYPEVALAREKALCYMGIGLVTDYDAGAETTDNPVSFRDVAKTFDDNIKRVRLLLEKIVTNLPTERTACACADALNGAEVKP